jgi:hypothetical protein
MNDLRRNCRVRPIVIMPVRETFEWYSNWKKKLFARSHCGWRGLGSAAFPHESWNDRVPRCDHGVGYVEFPSLSDTERAQRWAMKKRSETCPKSELRLSDLEDRIRRFEHEKLKHASQLPELTRRIPGVHFGRYEN